MIRRHLAVRIRESLEYFPVVLLTGARQVGKSTLAQAMRSAAWPAKYLTLDDRAVHDALLRDPDGFVAGNPPPLILDEVQRAPDLLRAIKMAVDRDRRPGSYLLTGSANLLTLRAVSETLAGRVAVHTLHPFSWSEIVGKPNPSGILDDLFQCRDARDLLVRFPRGCVPAMQEDVQERIIAGGYPPAALMASPRARSRWFAGYRQTYLERDVRDLADIERLPEFGRLLTLLAARTGQLLNYADLSRDLDLPYTTLRRYMGLLEATYQLFLLPPYFTNIGQRLVKMPKLYLTDTGMACHLTAARDWVTLERQGRAGALVETWVASELRKVLDASDGGGELFFWRTHAGREVDFLLVRGEDVVAVEVKWTRRLDEKDLAGLRSCREALGDRLRMSVLLHPGEAVLAVDERTVAVPMSVFFGVAT